MSTWLDQKTRGLLALTAMGNMSGLIAQSFALAKFQNSPKAIAMANAVVKVK